MDNFLSLAIKYVWEILVFMVQTGTVANNIFRQVDHIQISDIHHQAH